MANAWGISWGDGGGGVAPPVDGGIVGMIASGLTRALAVISADKEEDLAYATTPGGAFTALTGFVIHQDLLTEPTYDDDSRGGSQTRRAYCKGPVSPRLLIGYQIRDNTQIPAMIWAVEGVISECQQIATLARQERVNGTGPDRGASA